MENERRTQPEGSEVLSIKRRLADAIRRIFGLSISRVSAVSGQAEDQLIRDLLATLRIDCVFDVGANVGQYANHLRTLGYRGRILSFEPGPSMFATLERMAAADPLWDAFPFALGEEQGAFAFNIMKMDTMSSFLEPNSADDAVYGSINVVERVVEVEMRRLATEFDRLQARFGFERPFLKLDTQGFDLNVVRGAGDRIGRFGGILSEVALRRLYAGSPPLRESLETLEASGFDLVGLYKVRQEELLNPREFNCYVVRRDLAG
jgi:FkbM family methyltransferase